MADDRARQVPTDVLRDFAAAVLVERGMPQQDAVTTAWAMLEADLRGHPSHGISRLPSYAHGLDSGSINPQPAVRVERESPVSGVVDGDLGMGHVVVMTAVEAALRKAGDIGIGWVGTRRSNHAGAGGVYTRLAAERGYIAVYLAVSGKNFMAPWGGTQRMLGTNPIAVGIPSADGTPLDLDMATSVAAMGKILLAAGTGEPIPEGWVIDGDGQPITDPARVDEGSLVPIGGAKGYGLALVIGMLAGVLNGAAFGHDVGTAPEVGGGTGQTFVAVRPDLFAAPDAFEEHVARHLHDLRDSTPRSDVTAVRTPGDAIPRQRAHAQVHGVSMPSPLLARLRDLTSPTTASLLDG